MPQPLPFVLLNKLQHPSLKETFLLCRDDSFIQHYSAQVSSQEGRVYWVHQLKAKITFISYSKSRTDQTKRDNRTVAKAKQWNLEDGGQPDTALFQFLSIRRAVMAFTGDDGQGWTQQWPPAFTITSPMTSASPTQLLLETRQSRHKGFSYPLIPIRHWSYFMETFHQWPCGTNSPEPAAQRTGVQLLQHINLKREDEVPSLDLEAKGNLFLNLEPLNTDSHHANVPLSQTRHWQKSTLFLLSLLLFSLVTQPHQSVTHCSTEQKHPGHSEMPVSQWDTPCVRAPGLLVGAAEVQPAQNHILPCSKPHHAATAPAASSQLSKTPPTLQRKLQVLYCF